MVACYPGAGSPYVTHVDNPNRDGRYISTFFELHSLSQHCYHQCYPQLQSFLFFNWSIVNGQVYHRHLLPQQRLGYHGEHFQCFFNVWRIAICDRTITLKTSLVSCRRMGVLWSCTPSMERVLWQRWALFSWNPHSQILEYAFPTPTPRHKKLANPLSTG